MAIEQENFLATHFYDRVAKLDDQMNVRHLPNTKSAWKKQMMGRMAWPKCGQAKDALRPFFFDPPGDCRYDVRVGCERQMGPVLLERPERKEDEFVGELEFLNFWPG